MARSVVTKARKQAKAPKWQTHVYLNESDAKRLMEVAERDSRSVTGQIEYYIRRGLAFSSTERSEP